MWRGKTSSHRACRRRRNYHRAKSCASPCNPAKGPHRVERGRWSFLRDGDRGSRFDRAQARRRRARGEANGAARNPLARSRCQESPAAGRTEVAVEDRCSDSCLDTDSPTLGRTRPRAVSLTNSEPWPNLSSTPTWLEFADSDAEVGCVAAWRVSSTASSHARAPSRTAGGRRGVDGGRQAACRSRWSKQSRRAQSIRGNPAVWTGTRSSRPRAGS